MRILAIFAHPDDESYGPAGTLAKYALNGHQVSLVTLTQGEAGSLGEAKKMGPKKLAQTRVQELTCAVKELHIQDFSVFNLPDKGLERIPAEEGIYLVMQEIRRVNPEVVITFHQEGISGHPDHRTVSHWTFQAVKRLERGIRLFYYGVSPEQARRLTIRKLIPIPSGEITHRIDVREYLSYKLNAIRCHYTQLEMFNKIEKSVGDFSRYAGEECFSQVLPYRDFPEVRSEF